MRIDYLFGTETGTAEAVCEDLKEAFPGIESSVRNLEDTDPASLGGDRLYVVVCSTFGTGNLPASAVSFYDALRAKKPDLTHVRFAIFGLGDTTFGDTYAQGSEKLMAAMTACGAQMQGERGIADASGEEFPEDIAIAWLKPLLEHAGSSDGLSAA